MSKYAFSLLPEDGRRHALMAFFLSLPKLLRLWEQYANATNADREAGCDPEDDLPCVGLATNAQICTGCADVAEAISLLEDTGHKTFALSASVQCDCF